jgi:hypothetical protein
MATDEFADETNVGLLWQTLLQTRDNSLGLAAKSLQHRPHFQYPSAVLEAPMPTPATWPRSDLSSTDSGRIDTSMPYSVIESHICIERLVAEQLSQGPNTGVRALR